MRRPASQEGLTNASTPVLPMPSAGAPRALDVEVREGRRPGAADQRRGRATG
jgi:hypothetical protein